MTLCSECDDLTASRVLGNATRLSRMGTFGPCDHNRALFHAARRAGVLPKAARERLEAMAGVEWGRQWRDLLMARSVELLARGYLVGEVADMVCYGGQPHLFRRDFVKFSESRLGVPMNPDGFRRLVLLGRKEHGNCFG